MRQVQFAGVSQRVKLRMHGRHDFLYSGLVSVYVLMTTMTDL